MPRAPSSDSSKPTGLVGHWRFDETGTGVAIDYSGSGNHSPITGATRVAGQIGGALSFNGSSNFVTTPNTTVPNYLTVSAWIKIATMPTTYNDHIVSHGVQGDPNGTRTWELEVDHTNSDKILFYISTDGDSVFKAYSATVPIVDTWHHIVGIYDGSNATAYLNKVAGTSISAVGTLASYNRPIYIGKGPYLPTPDGYFDGIIDDVRIYNRALEQWEIQKIYDDTA